LPGLLPQLYIDLLTAESDSNNENPSKFFVGVLNEAIDSKIKSIFPEIFGTCDVQLLKTIYTFPARGKFEIVSAADLVKEF
jgi:hypothetical protein